VIAQLVTSLRLCSALLATHGAEVSPDRLCRAAVIVGVVVALVVVRVTAERLRC